MEIHLQLFALSIGELDQDFNTAAVTALPKPYHLFDSLAVLFIYPIVSCQFPVVRRASGR